MQLIIYVHSGFKNDASNIPRVRQGFLAADRIKKRSNRLDT